MFLSFFDGTSIFKHINVIDRDFPIYAVYKDDDSIVISINEVGFIYKQKKFLDSFNKFSYKFYNLLEQEIINNIEMSSELIKMIFSDARISI